MQEHRNNFDFLRLMFAIFVIVTHSYALTGSSGEDVLSRLTAHQLSLSGLGVKGFFIISGYLIFQSVLRCRNWKDYMVRRVLRIYPAYAIALVVCALVGLLVTSRTMHEYLASPSPYIYVASRLVMFWSSPDSISGVFETNPYKNAVNGSLWTIPYEFLFYIVLSLCFIIKKFPKLLLAVVALVYIGSLLFTIRYEDKPGFSLTLGGFEWHGLAHLGLYFCAGALLAALQLARWKYRKLLLLISLALLIILLATHSFYFTQYAILPLVVLLFGIMDTPGISGLSNKIGDWSYGIYLYGFLVQQTLMHYHAFATMQLTLFATLASIALGATSWHLVEKRALKLKRYFP